MRELMVIFTIKASAKDNYQGSKSALLAMADQKVELKRRYINVDRLASQISRAGSIRPLG